MLAPIPRWNAKIDYGIAIPVEDGEYVLYSDYEQRIAKLTADRDEFERKGKELCSAYGNALITIHDLKATLGEIEKYAIYGCGTKQKDARGKQFAAIVDLAYHATRTPPQAEKENT